MADHAGMTLMMSLALDGLLAREEQEAFEGHLRRCAGCQEQWARWQRVDALLAAEPVVAPSPDFSARVLARVNQHAQRQRRLLGGALLLGGSLSVWGMVLLGLAGAALLWVLSDPSVAVHGARVIWQLIATGNLLARAVELGLESLVDPSVLPLLLTFVCVTVALTALWLRLVQRRPQGVPALMLLV